MTDREKAIVMAYTGVCMLKGDKFNEFYRYLAELYGRPIYSHELITLNIKHKSKPDFLKLCDDEESERKTGRWIPCSERLPEKSGQYYVSGESKVWICEFLTIHSSTILLGGWCNDAANPVVQAWMPLPEPWKEGEAE